MAIGGSDLSLLFKLRAQNEASPAIKATQADIAKLKTTFNQDFGQIQNIANSALSNITTNLTRLSGNLPVVGTAVNGLASSLGTMAGEGTAAAGSLASIAGPAGIAVVAVGVLAAGVIGLHKALFTLAESAAGFRGKLFDLSQQTGVSVETLNALEIAAGKTGGSIESISQSLVIFQGHLDEAQDSSSKAGKKFAELGISTNNTEKAFRDALKALAAMPAGFHQTNEAAELFGRRGGKQVLALLKETDGNIDSVVDNLGELARVTTAEAKAADDFSDALRDLNTLMRGAFGKEAIPAATDALKDLTKVLQENEDAIKAIGFALGVLSTLIGGEFKRSLQVLSELWRQAEAPIRVLTRAYENLADAMERVGLIAKQTLADATAGVSGGTGRGTGEFGGGTDAVSALAAHQPLGEVTRTSRARTGGKSDVERELEGQLKALQSLNSELRVALDIETKVDTKTREYAVSQSILTGELSKADAGLKAMALTIAKSIDASNKRVELENRLIEFQKAQNEAVREAIEGEKGFLKITDEFIKALEKEGRSVGRAEEFWLRFNAAILANAAARKTLAATIESLPPIEVSGVAGAGLTEEQIGQLAGAAANAQVGIPPEAIEESLARNIAITASIDTMREAFFGLGEALGQVIESFVLYGSAGASVQKVTAQILAGIAKQAAMKAIFELAEGFAALAMAFFGIPNAGPSAAAHFTAAAIYGGIAGIAAASGRVVAGGAFASNNSGGGATSSAGGRGSSGTPSRPNVTDADRLNYNVPAPAKEVLEIRFTGQLGDVIEHHWVDRYKGGGRLRNLVTTDRDAG